MQSPAAIIMLKPDSFGYNPETAATNTFQNKPSDSDIQLLANREFEKVQETLVLHHIKFITWNDSLPAKPDAVFLNNWFSTHSDGRVILYPMLTPNRRDEVRLDLIDSLRPEFQVNEIIDLRAEADGRILEGTGSMVMDHSQRLIYANLSERTDAEMVRRVAILLGYEPILFESILPSGVPVYHTNVLMSLGKEYAILCLDVIPDEASQEQLLDRLSASGRKIIAISREQMEQFAGNVLEVLDTSGAPVLLISDTALNSLVPGQVRALDKLTALVPVSIPTIQQVGGGGIRCMVAGNFLPPASTF